MGVGANERRVMDALKGQDRRKWESRKVWCCSVVTIVLYDVEKWLSRIDLCCKHRPSASRCSLQSTEDEKDCQIRMQTTWQQCTSCLTQKVVHRQPDEAFMLQWLHWLAIVAVADGQESGDIGVVESGTERVQNQPSVWPMLH